METMDNRLIGKIIYFWVFMIGVIVIGKLTGLMEDGRTTIIICLATAGVYIGWNVFRSLGRRKRVERQWQARQEAIKKKGNKRNPTHRRLLHQRALRSAPVIINLLIASH